MDVSVSFILQPYGGCVAGAATKPSGWVSHTPWVDSPGAISCTRSAFVLLPCLPPPELPCIPGLTPPCSGAPDSTHRSDSSLFLRRCKKIYTYLPLVASECEKSGEGLQCRALLGLSCIAGVGAGEGPAAHATRCWNARASVGPLPRKMRAEICIHVRSKQQSTQYRMSLCGGISIQVKLSKLADLYVCI